MSLNHRERVLASLNREIPDRCPMQVCFTPEFNKRLREYYKCKGYTFKPEAKGEINLDLEFLTDQDMLLSWVGWTDETKITYIPGEEFFDKWGVLRRATEYDSWSVILWQMNQKFHPINAPIQTSLSFTQEQTG
jgi:hypothetical protein